MTAYQFIETHPIGKRLPISKELRLLAALAYSQQRHVGKSHKEAVAFAKQKVYGVSPLVMILLSVAFQVLWYLLKKWWENRNADNSP